MIYRHKHSWKLCYPIMRTGKFSGVEEYECGSCPARIWSSREGVRGYHFGDCATGCVVHDQELVDRELAAARERNGVVV